MRFKFHLFPIMILIAVLAPTRGHCDENYRFWAGLFGKKNLNSNFDFFNEAQVRYNLNQGSMQQVMLRPGLLHQLNASHEVGFLFAFIQTGTMKEYRPTLQHLWTAIAQSDLNLTLRSRFEFRDLEDNDVESIRYRLAIQNRYFWNTVLSNVISNEIFANLTREDWSGDRLIERNRIFVGLGINQNTYRYDFGYLNQFIPRTGKNINEHVLVINFYY